MHAFQSMNSIPFWNFFVLMWKRSKRVDSMVSTRTPRTAFTDCFASMSSNGLMPNRRPLPGMWKWMKATLDHGYDGLVLEGYKHYRVHHSENEFARGRRHINGIESFWSYAKTRLARLRGIRSCAFFSHLKKPNGATITCVITSTNSCLKTLSLPL